MGRIRVALAAAGVAAAVLVPTAALGADLDDGGTTSRSDESGVAEPSDELGASRERLAGQRRELTEVEAAVRRTNDEVAALDLKLTSAATALAAVAAELDGAREAAATAADAERTAATRLAAADASLRGAVDALHDNRVRLADRAVYAFKHGGGSAHDLLVRGVTGAQDFHEVAVTLETVGRLTSRDRELLDARAAFTRTTAQERAEVADLRRLSMAASRTAADEAQRLADLVDEHARVVSDVRDAHDARRTALAGLQADAAARAVLVRDLEQRVASLELDASRVLVSIDVDLDPFGPPPPWAAGLPGEGPTWAAAVAATAARNGIDGRLLAALVWTESNFTPNAVSHAGALGLAQLMPGTAAGLGVDPRDPLANLDGGARYLRGQLDRFGRVDLALAAYNAGPGRVERAGGVPDIVETQLYVVRVLDRYGQLGG